MRGKTKSQVDTIRELMAAQAAAHGEVVNLIGAAIREAVAAERERIAAALEADDRADAAQFVRGMK